MTYPKCIRTLYALLMVALTAFAQTPPAQTSDAQAAPPPADPPAWTLGGIKFSGLVDGFYSFNANHPASGSNSIVRVYDQKTNTFSLNMAKLAMEHAPEPIGFRVDLGFGRGMDIYNSFEPLSDARNINMNIMQAYISVKPKTWGGFQFDFGKFATHAGAELTDTHLNFNYSRSLIYALGPFYHFGARVTKPVTSYWTVGFHVVNGWNNVDDNNSGKTIGFTNAFVGKRVGYYNNYYAGPEKTGTNEGKRQFIDQVLTVTANDKATLYLNYDYGYEKALDGTKGIISAIAGAAKFQANSWFAISPRLEYFNDRGIWTSGAVQKLKEFTLTGEFKHPKGFLTRIEYRRDWSNVAYFDRGNENASAKSQNTLLIGFIAYFGE
ncbi:MAG: porin [Acidobacteriia bacterium]|nr:porin [Terriglobia bacterium]